MNQTSIESFDRRGRRVEIYEYNGTAKVDSKKLIGTVGIVLYEEGLSTIVFCPAVNRSLTFVSDSKEFSYIWNRQETKNLSKYNKNLYISSQNKR